MIYIYILFYLLFVKNLHLNSKLNLLMFILIYRPQIQQEETGGFHNEDTLGNVVNETPKKEKVATSNN